MNNFETFGAVMVTPRNFYRLMETGQAGLLFPGGVREVWHGKGEEYRLFWPESTDFVRIAARFNATIVPLSALGAAEGVNILLDSKEMATLPFGLGDRIQARSANVTAARFGSDNESELFAPPLVVPKGLPDRHYFMFGRPLDTTDVDPKDRAGCARLYGEIKDDMERGFADVRRAREQDPYRGSVARAATERLTGRPAPTFGMGDLSSPQ